MNIREVPYNKTTGIIQPCKKILVPDMSGYRTPHFRAIPTSSGLIFNDKPLYEQPYLNHKVNGGYIHSYHGDEHRAWSYANNYFSAYAMFILAYDKCSIASMAVYVPSLDRQKRLERVKKILKSPTTRKITNLFPELKRHGAMYNTFWGNKL